MRGKQQQKQGMLSTINIWHCSLIGIHIFSLKIQGNWLNPMYHINITTIEISYLRVNTDCSKKHFN